MLRGKTLDQQKQHAFFSWAVMGALVLLCTILAGLQYKWTGEVSRAERDRLVSTLKASLNRLSIDFNGDLETAAVGLVPVGPGRDMPVTEDDYLAQYSDWKRTGKHDQIFSRIVVATPVKGLLTLRQLDPLKEEFVSILWPEEWAKLESRLLSRLNGRPSDGRVEGGGLAGLDSTVLDIPRFTHSELDGPRARFSPSADDHHETSWLLLEVNTAYVRGTMLPELVQRHLGNNGIVDYRVQVNSRAVPQKLIFTSDDEKTSQIGSSADASVGLFDVPFERLMRRGQGGRKGGKGGGGKRPTGGSMAETEPGQGRWLLQVQHRAGSVDALVRNSRLRNLGVAGLILLLMLATVAALMRFTKRSQQLAELQMDFVAGVSHELRTPLTVIRTAAYNLRGKVAANPAQVERYGNLIESESEKLTGIVEDILRFASTRAGKIIQERESLAVDKVIEESVEASKSALGNRCALETTIESGLPRVMGDSSALRHVVQNLLSNAAKYGTEGSDWIGISAVHNAGAVEIRVCDRGTGIPEEEQGHIFEPFYRGRRAVQEQIHGTGLGLSLVKKIVEAHGGTITVASEASKGTQFLVRIPVAPIEHQNEFSNSVG